MTRIEIAKAVGLELRRIGVFVGSSTLRADAGSEIQSIYVSAQGDHVSFFGQTGRAVANETRGVAALKKINRSHPWTESTVALATSREMCSGCTKTSTT